MKTIDTVTEGLVTSPPLQMRTVRVGKLFQRGTLAEGLSVQETVGLGLEERKKEWREWRNVQDRVDKWLNDNATTEADESHIITMLLDTDLKKTTLF